MTSEWKDWYTETYEYTVGSIENLNILILNKYMYKINENLRCNKSIYSPEYINELSKNIISMR